MPLVFDSCWLLWLRHAVVGLAPLTSDDLVTCSALARVPALQCARTEYAALSDKQDAGAVLSIWRDVWAALGSLVPVHPLYVPPIYDESPALTQLLHHIATSVRRCEVRHGLGGTGHVALGGVEGAGKSTLVKAVSIAVAACCPTYFFAYIDYSAEGIKGECVAPWRLLAELLARHRARNFSRRFGAMISHEGVLGNLHPAVIVVRDEVGWTMSDMAGALARADPPLVIGYIADEAQKLLLPHAATTSPEVLALAAIADFGKTHPRAMIIVTGSSINIRGVLFRHSRGGLYPQYADFNGGLCADFSVAALRTVPELRRYLQRRYRDLEKVNDDDYVCRLLHLTGGIGRFVHEAITSDLPGDRHARLEEAMGDADFAALVHFIRAAKPIDGALETAIAAWKSGDDGKHLAPEDVSIDFSAVAEAMRSRLPPGTALDRLVMAWVDRSLLYCEVPARTVQLARPADARVLFADAVSRHDQDRMVAVAAMLYGDIRSNAGAPLEDLLLPRIHRLMPAAGASELGMLRIADEGKLQVRGAEGVWADLAPGEVTALTRKTWRWHCEQGVDGLQFEIPPDASGVTVITIHAWQCKGGDATLELGAGELSTYRREGAKASYDYAASALARAERGLLEVATAALTTFPSATVALGQLLLTVTRKATLTLTASPLVTAPISIPDEVVVRYVTTDVLPRLSVRRYSVKFMHGTAWIGACFEGRARATWAWVMASYRISGAAVSGAGATAEAAAAGGGGAGASARS